MLIEAMWARMCAGTREDGSIIQANDPSWDALSIAALGAKSDPMVWLGQSQFYGDLGQNTRVSERFVHWLKLIWTEGTETALNEYLAA